MKDDVTTISGYQIDSAEFALPIGTIVDERYEIKQMIGQGGMCVVYEAQHLQLRRRVALKLLHLTCLSSPEAFERFKREAILASDVKHPNIIEVFGFGIWRKRPYIAMEFLEGQTLTQLVDAEGPLAEPRAINVLVQICDALQEAHAQHIVHRDLKPSNVIILQGDKVKLVDFGIARLLPESGEEVQKLTQTGQVLGSFFYMSPEQCMGKPVSPATDFYAFGCLMYKLLTGETPFGGDSPFSVMGQHLGVAPPAMANVSGNLQAIAFWCLRKEPTERPANGADLKAALLGDNQKVTKPLSAAVKQKQFKLSSAGKVALLTFLMIAIAGGAFTAYFCMHNAPRAEAPIVDPEERRLISAVEKAARSQDDNEIARTNDKLCQYYSERGLWQPAERAGYNAWRAAEHASKVPFDEQLRMTYRMAVAVEHNKKLRQASMTYFNIANRLLDAPKDLRQLCCLREAKMSLMDGLLLRADRHFRKGIAFGTAAGFGTLQELRLDYAQFLLLHPDVRQLALNHVKMHFCTHEYDDEDVTPTTFTPRGLLEQIVADGAHSREDELRLAAAKKLLSNMK